MLKLYYSVDHLDAAMQAGEVDGPLAEWYYRLIYGDMELVEGRR